MSKKSIKTQFIDQLINLLLSWSEKKDRAFMLIICDKKKTNVAYRNQEKLTADGVLALSADPCGFALEESINVGMDFFTEDVLKDPAMQKAIADVPYDDHSWSWWSMNFE